MFWRCKKLALMLLRMLYLSCVNIKCFTQGWGVFFREERHNLRVLFGLLFLWHYFVRGFPLTCVGINVALVVSFRRFIAGGLCTSTKRLTGQTVIITGANVGIGKETARDMLRRGARVILACRDLQKAEATKQNLQGEGGIVEVRKLDLSSLQSVRDFADGIIRDNIKVHILINNAGIMMCPYMETEEGFEMQMGTNHLGHFLLTNLLLPQMKHGEPTRVINITSNSHNLGQINFEQFTSKVGYDRLGAYDNSKLAIILFTRQLAKLLKGSQIQVFSAVPSTVGTGITRYFIPQFLRDYFFPLVMKTPMEGAQTTIYCATEAEQHEEMYFSDCAVGWPSKESKDDVLSEQLWRVSAELVGLDK